MNAFVLYLLLLKAIVTTFSGLASVPIVRNDLVLHRHVLTDREMNTSLAITRTTPGPMGLYVVSVGYFVDGTPGAIAGWVAMITPALLMIPLLEFVRRKAEHPRFKAVLRCVVFASAGLLLWVTVPLARDAIHGYLTIGIALTAFMLGVTKKVDSVWIVLSAVAITMLVPS
jgi:chromate transporter